MVDLIEKKSGLGGGVFKVSIRRPRCKVVDQNYTTFQSWYSNNSEENKMADPIHKKTQ